MAIFNSLGSNYNFAFVRKSILNWGKTSDISALNSFLSQKYGGEVSLFYKGREALTFAFEILNLPHDSRVAINGFTCVAVFNGIRKAGLEPLCLDLDKSKGLNFTPKALEKAVLGNKKIRAVVIQNTLGYPCDIEEIQKICKKYNLALIEDLAHSIGTKYKNGKEAGTVGDMTVLSFSQDKIIDAVTGGSLVIRSSKFKKSKTKISYSDAPSSKKYKLYPYFTYKIRKLYTFGLGKSYHFLLKKMNLLTEIMNEAYYDYYSLPSWYAGLALYQFSNLQKQLSHRRKIAQIYANNLPDNILMFNKKEIHEAVSLSSNLRFPIFVKNRSELLGLLKKDNIFLFDIWYKDVAPDCPNAVYEANTILNLPTHINVSESDAHKICEIINTWMPK